MKFAIVLLCAILVTATLARADEQPTNTGPLTPSEQSFVDAVRTDLVHRFPRVTDAEKAGYVRYTGIDDTGAISYADRRWNSDPTHPSQLWYDVSGNLLGADFSVPRPHQEARPVLWGIDAGRWSNLTDTCIIRSSIRARRKRSTTNGFGTTTSRQPAAV